MRGYLQFSFWIPIALLRSPFPYSHKPRKNTSVLVGNVLKCNNCLFLTSTLSLQSIFKLQSDDVNVIFDNVCVFEDGIIAIQLRRISIS